MTSEGAYGPAPGEGLAATVRRLIALDAVEAYDLILVGHRGLALELAASPLAGRLWTCLDDVPEWAAGVGAKLRGELSLLAEASRFLLVRTEEARGVVEAAAAAAVGKCLLAGEPAAVARFAGYLDRAFPRPSPGILRWSDRSTSDRSTHQNGAGRNGAGRNGAGQNGADRNGARQNGARQDVRHRPRRLRVGVTGHDLKFFTGLLEHFRSRSDLDVRPAQSSAAFWDHDPRQARRLADWADVIICEWCGANAVWHARHKRPGQRLIVRLHRFELHTPWPGRLDIDAVDKVICVSPHYAEAIRITTGWPLEKITVLPNTVDVDQLDRTKLPGAEYRIGMLGAVPASKRLDLALEVLAELRRHDPRFTLFVKSRLPWDVGHIWQRAEEVDHYRKVFHRLDDPLLRRSVVFDPFGRDVASWLRGIGFVLSTSDHESFHLAPAEGMASGAIPAFLGWPGAERLYGPRWIHDDPVTMAASIARVVREGHVTAERRAARSQVRSSYALDALCRRWISLIEDSLSAPSGAQENASGSSSRRPWK
ncbi:hypothetical protein CCS38_24105 [Streptomyces purpurogeneiscleroticus]|nr:hypothetical protein [Streptomyces purpurogeneiscleroticus]